MSAVAKRGEITLAAVVMGAADSKSRFRDAAALLNYGFGTCNLYTDENKEKIPAAPLKGGLEEKIACTYKEPFHYLDTTGKNLEGVKKRLEYKRNLKAPVKKGSVVGKAIYTLDGKEIGTVDLVSTREVKKAGYWDYLKRAAGNLLRMKERTAEE